MLVHGNGDEMDETLVNKLIESADDARKMAYAPYSNFRVGCAVLLSDGQIITGVNVENASYPATICAERTAITQVVSKGIVREIKAISIVTHTKNVASPCGICRQVLSEFIDDSIPVILANTAKKYEISNISLLLPGHFDKEALNS